MAKLLLQWVQYIFLSILYGQTERNSSPTQIDSSSTLPSLNHFVLFHGWSTYPPPWCTPLRNTGLIGPLINCCCKSLTKSPHALPNRNRIIMNYLSLLPKKHTVPSHAMKTCKAVQVVASWIHQFQQVPVPGGPNQRLFKANPSAVTSLGGVSTHRDWSLAWHSELQWQVS